MNKSYLLGGLGAIIAASSFSAAQADDERWPRWYIGLSGSYAIMQDSDISGGNSGADRLNLNNGYGVGGSIGYLPSSSVPFINALRFEAEISYHQNNVHSVGYTGGHNGIGNGNYDSTAYMVNSFYDLPISGSPWSPYIGAGAGFATVHLPTNSGAGNTQDSTNEFAYQFMAGIGYTPVTIPNTQWTLGYRYLATEDPTFGGNGSDVKTQYASHNIELGAKFRF